MFENRRDRARALKMGYPASYIERVYLESNNIKVLNVSILYADKENRQTVAPFMSVPLEELG